MKSRVCLILTGAGERARLLWKDACYEPRNHWSGYLDSEGKGRKIARKLGEYFVWGQNRDREGLFYHCARSLFPFLFIDPSLLTPTLASSLNSSSIGGTKPASCIPLLWSQKAECTKAKHRALCMIDVLKHGEGEARVNRADWNSSSKRGLAVFGLLCICRGWLFRGLIRMNMSKLSCYESAKRMVIVDQIHVSLCFANEGSSWAPLAPYK